VSTRRILRRWRRRVGGAAVSPPPGPPSPPKGTVKGQVFKGRVIDMLSNRPTIILRKPIVAYLRGSIRYQEVLDELEEEGHLIPED